MFDFTGLLDFVGKAFSKRQDVTVAAAAPRRNYNQALEILREVVIVGGLIMSLKICLHYLDPYREQREEGKKRAAFINKHLGRSIQLNEYEQLLATNVMNPAKIDVSLDDINGLEDIIHDMEMKVLAPMMSPDLYCTTLWRQAKGVLLYGPPGTGKTMLAKALAKESRCFFLNITASSIMSKWLGDANRLIRAVFSLAEKLQPCIIFVDEVDAILGKRGGHSEHEATLQVKTEFMQLWDGMESSRGQRIVVMGATNRPWMVDEAVLRRFSLQYEMGLPSQEQRAKILEGYLRRHHTEVGDDLGGVDEALLNNTPVAGSGGVGALEQVAVLTAGFSGSDLVELCAQAAQRVLGEYWAQAKHSGGSGADLSVAGRLRALSLEDFQSALPHVRPSVSKANEYREAASAQEGGAGQDEVLRFMAALLQQGARSRPGGSGNGGGRGDSSGGREGGHSGANGAANGSGNPA